MWNEQCGDFPQYYSDLVNLEKIETKLDKVYITDKNVKKCGKNKKGKNE